MQKGDDQHLYNSNLTVILKQPSISGIINNVCIETHKYFNSTIHSYVRSWHIAAQRQDLRGRYERKADVMVCQSNKRK